MKGIMVIVVSDPGRLEEFGFEDFITYDDGKAGVSIMGPEEAYYYAYKARGWR